MKARILIVEDDPAILKLIDTNLSVAGYQTVYVVNGHQALAAIRDTPFDLALLDIMLPGPDGFELLPHMQAKQIPVIYISAKADIESRIQGLRLGAEDYLVKPFDILELLVRVEKVLQRAVSRPLVLCFLDVCVDEISHTVTQAGNTIPLKPMEYDLLVNFLRHPGKLLTREHLLRQVWGDEYIGETRTVDVHVARLRKMLGWSTDQIATVYKLGYRLEAEP